MKSFLHILADIALLPVSGCIFPRNRDSSEDCHVSEAPPPVSEIKEGMDETIAAVKENLVTQPPAPAQTGH